LNSLFNKLLLTNYKTVKSFNTAINFGIFILNILVVHLLDRIENLKKQFNLMEFSLFESRIHCRAPAA